MIATAQTRVLQPNVHAVAIGDDIVFLDVTRDRYVCLPDGVAVVRLESDSQVVAISDVGLADDLKASGLVGDGPGLARPSLHLDKPAASALLLPFEPWRWRDLPQVTWALSDLGRSYWRRPLSDLVAWAVQGAMPAARAPSPELLAVVAGFHRWAPYVPAPSKCLLRSYLLLRVLRRHGHDACWVFGVRTWPFRAHCWLQCGDTVLDDDVDPLVALTPILAV